MLDRTGEVTPPTQWATRLMVTLRVGAGGFLIAGGAFPDGDAVPDGDLLGSDEDVLDEQPQHALAFGDARVLGVAAELGEEAFQVVGELEVGVAVGELGVDGAGLAAQARFAGPQGGHPGAQLVDGDQLFLECLDHPGDRGGSLGLREFQPLALAGGRVAGAGLLEAFADLGADQRGVGEQVRDVVPDDGVEVVGADWLVAADPAAFVAVVIRAQAPVVADLLVRGAGGGAVVAVSAGRAGGQALQQGGDLGVAGGEPLVVLKAPGGALERLGGHDGGDGDLDPVPAGPVDGLGRPRCGPALQAGPAVQARRLLQDLRLAEHCDTCVGRVAQHAPDHRPVPAGLAGAGGDVFAGKPAGQAGDGGAVVGVTAEQLSDDRRLMADDLVAGAAVCGLVDVAVAERGAAQDVDRPGPGPVGLAAPVALHQLRLLIFGEHALELHHQLVFGAVAARSLDELHAGPGAGELLDQQRLVGELAGQPVRGVDEHHIDADPGDHVPQPLQGGPDQRGPRMPLVLEHPLLRQLNPQLPGVGAQRRRLRPDRLVLLLPGAGDPGVDRRARHGAAFLPGRPARCGPAAVAREWRRPPTNPWPHDGQRRTPSRPPGRSPARGLSAAPREELGQRAGHHGGDRGLALARVGAHPPRQPRRQLDGEHHARLGHLHPPLSHGLVHIPAGLAHRDREPGSQHRGGLRHRDTSLRQLSRRVDPPGVLRITCAAATSHDTNILPDMSPITRNTPWSFQPPVAQSDVKAEVAHCVGGVASPVLSNIYLDRLDKFVETVLIPEYTRGTSRAPNPAYRKVIRAMTRARRRGDRTAVRQLRRQLRGLPSRDPHDPGYRRLRYIRYADDHLLGFAGPKAEAEQIKARLAAFLRDDLKLELSQEKTLIISTYGAEYRGIVQYYLLAGDVWRLNRLEWVAATSMLKTLAAKHGSSVTKMARQYKAKIETPYGPRTCFQASVQRADRKPLAVRFGGIPLRRQKKAVLTDRQPIPATGPKELTTRLLRSRCEWCEQRAPVEIHQVRALADLTRPRQPQPEWAHRMATMRRKTLVVCIPCHQAIHAGQPAATPTQ